MNEPHQPQPAGLPPISIPQVPVGVPGFPPTYRPAPVAPSNPVGRPSNDPEQQAQRAERTQAAKRLDSLTPNRAKDHKLHVYRTDGSGRTRGKPALTLLATDIESHLASAPPDARDQALDELIVSRMPESQPDGTYKCQWYDAQNHPVMTPPPWEVDIGEGGAEDLDDEEVDELEETAGRMPVVTTFPQHPAQPPTAPALDMTAVGNAMRAERADAERRGNDTMSMIMGFNNTILQLMTQQQLQSQQAAAQAEERERARRAEFRTTLLASIPLVLPVLTPLFNRPAQAGPSPELQMLLKLIENMASNKGTDLMTMEKMMSFQTEMMKSQIQLQAQGAATALQTQAEVSGIVAKNLTNQLKEALETRGGGGSENGGVMETLAKLAGPFLASMAQQQPQNAATPEMPAQTIPAAPPARAVARAQSEKAPPPPPAAAAAEAPRRAVRRAAPTAPAPAPAAPNPAQYPDARRIVGVMRAVRSLSLGATAPSERWKVVRWAAQMLPTSVVEPIKAQDKDGVMGAALPAVMQDSVLIQWITDEDNASFLEDFLQDVRLLVSGLATPEAMEASLIKGGQFVQRRAQTQAKAAAAADASVAKHNNPPDTGESPAVVQSASIVPQGGDNIAPPIAAQPVDTPETPRTASTKTPPPSPQG